MQSRKTKKRQSKRKQLSHHTGEKFLIAALLLFIFVVLGICVDRAQSFSERVEDEANSVQKIPEEIRELSRLTPAAENIRVPILMYHYVEIVKDLKDTIRHSLDTLPSVLDSQIETLSDAGYTFMTAGELGEVLSGRMVLPKKPIVLTFDDGYSDFYTDAYPILKKYNASATIYVISGVLGEKNYLTKQQLEEIARDNLVEIAAHTVHHIYLTSVSREEVEKEVRESKSMLQKLSHKPVVSFAYPYGAFDEQALRVVREAGFTNAVSTVPGIESNERNKYYLFRLRPGTRTGQELLSYFDQSTFNPW